MHVDETTRQMIAAVHDSARKLVFEYAGAGSLALYWLHSVPGSSRTVLEATGRYSRESLAELIGRVPDKFVSEDTARAMASRAYRRAMRLTGGGIPCLGVGCTATIATDRAKRGDHGCWVAIQGTRARRLYGLVLDKGERDRAGEETMVSNLILHAIGEAAGLALPMLGLLPGERVERRDEPADDPIGRLLDGDATAEYVVVAPDGALLPEAEVPRALLSGSFNPLHAGHERLAQAASVALGTPCGFELPVVNADKPPLDYREVERRVEQFAFRYPVVLSRARLFVEKARLFPECTFAVGYDTAARLVDPRYYGGEAGRDTALGTVRAQRCRFIVAGRAVDGEFHTMRDLPIPAAFADLFLDLPEQLFRVDLSSSEIRAALSDEE
jgi:hypothetical protein